MNGLEDDELSGSTADLFGISTSTGTGRAAGIGSLLRGSTPPAVAAQKLAAEGSESGAKWIPVDRCVGNPRNPRDDVGDLADLKSIREKQHSSCTGVTPAAYLKLWPEDTDKIPSSAEVVIIAGNRRLKASHKYGRDKLLVLTDDAIATSKATLFRAAYDENTGRLDFDPVEEAKAALAIVDQYPTAKEACAAQGWTPGWVSQRRALLRLHPNVQALVRSKARGGDGISLRKARWLGARPGVEELGADEQLALLDGYLEDGAQKKRQAKGSTPPQTAATDVKIPPPARDPFTAVNQQHDATSEPNEVPPGTESFTAVNQDSGLKTEAKEGEESFESFTAVHRKDSPEPPNQRVATMSAVHVLTTLANTLAAVPVPADLELIDRARAEDPEAAALELGRIRDWAAALERLISQDEAATEGTRCAE